MRSHESGIGIEHRVQSTGFCKSYNLGAGSNSPRFINLNYWILLAFLNIHIRIDLEFVQLNFRLGHVSDTSAIMLIYLRAGKRWRVFGKCLGIGCLDASSSLDSSVRLRLCSVLQPINFIANFSRMHKA